MSDKSDFFKTFARTYVYSLSPKIYPPEHFRRKYSLDDVAYVDEVGTLQQYEVL